MSVSSQTIFVKLIAWNGIPLILDSLGKSRKALPGQVEAGLLPTQKHAAIAAARAIRQVVVVGCYQAFPAHRRVVM